jgi:adenosylmethionine---8-amino-7-oxononanoate aminotransferase
MKPAWMTRGAQHVWRPYCHHATADDPLPVVDASGVYLKLADGRRLIDGIASWWTSAHGYRHPVVEQHVRDQLHTLPHVAFGGLAHEPGYRLAERLASWCAEAGAGSLSRVFLVESGSVAVEVAVKMCLQAQAGWGQPQKNQVLAFHGGYHGDTFGTMALCDPDDGMHTALRSFAVGQVQHLMIPRSRADHGVFAHAFAAHAHNLAAVIIEPLLQSAGGMRLHSTSFLELLRDLCDEHGVLLIADEIATGFYRTGTRFAYLQSSIVPDVLVLGKALSAGTLPLACAIASNAIFDAVEARGALQHGPTYMANPLACAAAHASLTLFEQGGDAANKQRAALQAELVLGLKPLEDAGHQVRSLGVMVAIDVAKGTAPSSSAFAAHDVFVRPLRLPHVDVVYLMPALNMNAGEAAALTRGVCTVMRHTAPLR